MTLRAGDCFINKERYITLYIHEVIHSGKIYYSFTQKYNPPKKVILFSTREGELINFIRTRNLKRTFILGYKKAVDFR